MAGIRFGKAYVSINGELLPTLPGAQLALGGMERAPVMGDNQVLGFTETPVAATLTCEISLGEGMSLQRLRTAKDATITFECDSGQSYVVREAFTTKTLSITAGDNGKVGLEMSGKPAEEMGV